MSDADTFTDFARTIDESVRHGMATELEVRAGDLRGMSSDDVQVVVDERVVELRIKGESIGTWDLMSDSALLDKVSDLADWIFDQLWNHRSRLVGG